MESAAICLGAALPCVVLCDILMSALGTGSAGPVAPRGAWAMFSLLRALPERPFVHRICGPVVTAVVGAAWIVLM
ncbi:hypothetical protein [Oceanicola sp. S124]|uniref:hypothetical protein n=1 Tax=Oceanicola sp. S124 TaxID=1042378 RepID=UPI000255793F|nr:hypothetical protein [Oceanicola sp. S124]